MKAECPVCGRVLTGRAIDFYCEFCQTAWNDDEVLRPAAGLHQRDKHSAQNVRWHKPSVRDTQPIPPKRKED